MDPIIVVINEQGSVLQKIGGSRGEGPGEFTYGIRGMASSGDLLYAWDSARNKVVVFNHGEFSTEFKTMFSSSDQTSASLIAANGATVVISTGGVGGFLGMAYRDGVFQQMVGPVSLLLEAFQKINSLSSAPVDQNSKLLQYFFDSLWTFDQGHFYALSRYYPLLFQFDDALSFQRALPLPIDEAYYHFDEVFAREAIRSGEKTAVRFFIDFQVKDGTLYLLSQLKLNCTFFQVNLQRGTVDKRTAFLARESDLFSDLKTKMDSDESNRVCMDYFRVLDSGAILLGSTFSYWDHDCWVAENE
jgi:hypothetical protein